MECGWSVRTARRTMPCVWLMRTCVSKMFGEAADGFRVWRPPLEGYAGDMLWLVSVGALIRAPSTRRAYCSCVAARQPHIHSLLLSILLMERALMERESWSTVRNEPMWNTRTDAACNNWVPFFFSGRLWPYFIMLARVGVFCTRSAPNLCKNPVVCNGNKYSLYFGAIRGRYNGRTQHARDSNGWKMNSHLMESRIDACKIDGRENRWPMRYYTPKSIEFFVEIYDNHTLQVN